MSEYMRDYSKGYDDAYRGLEMANDASDGYYNGYEDACQEMIEEMEEVEDYDFEEDDNLTDAEADAMTLISAGWGTEEDYGYYGDEF